MDKKEILKSVYDDFFGIGKIERENEKLYEEIKNLKGIDIEGMEDNIPSIEVNKQQDKKNELSKEDKDNLMEASFKKIEELHITEESKELLKKIIEYIRKYNEKIEKQFISFNMCIYSENEEVSRNIKDLNKKCMNLQKIAEKEEEKGSHMEMLSYVDYVKGYPQVTVMWYILDDTTRIYNIMTLGADEKNSLPITSKEALEMTGMSGVDLSLKVGKLSKDSGIRGELLSTEMQGFRIDEEGKVKEIYMKLIMEIKKENETVEEEHFFSYIPEEEKLEKLSLRGYEVP